MPKLDRISPAVLASNPRASLASWLRYETVVVAAYRQHPKPYVFSTQNMKSSTVCSRIRDAIRGAIAFYYPVAEGAISTQDLSSWWGEVVVKPNADHVLIGPAEQVHEEIVTTKSDPRNLAFETANLDEIIAFTVLLSSCKISGPVTVFHPPDISQLPERENVEVMQRVDGSLVLM